MRIYIDSYRYGNIMARAQTTADIFNAIAEEDRRKIIGLLKNRELSVYQISERLKFTQPQVSKHLGVLKKVSVVNVRKEGRNRMYSLDPDALRPIYDWICPFEEFWNQSLDRLENFLKEKEDDE